MAAPAMASGPPITDPRELVAYLEAGCKPPEAWRIGTEHEKFVFDLETLRPTPYEGRSGIGALLEALIARYDWTPVLENGKPIALTQGECSISLEPGGQFELSGAPLETLHQTCDEVHTHLAQVKDVATELGVGFLGAGFNPKWKREDIPWMPKGRYEIMRAYMPTKGALGLDMMLRTCTIQVNLDFSSEADMVKKFRVGVGLQPVAVALFANSPIVEGKLTGYMSYRSHVWEDTDPDRSGILPFVFEDGMGFERYVDYMLDVPMYFVYRDGRYVSAAGQSFRDFLDGRLPAHPGDTPSMSDWIDHLTTAFPEVRLKRFLEMRGADGGPWARICALPALWVGLLYDQTALDAAWDIVKDWTVEEHEELRQATPRTALHTRIRGRTLRDLSLEVLEIARYGLKNRARLDHGGNDETGFLGILEEIAQRGSCPAERLIDRFETEWAGDIDRIFRDCAF